MKRLAMGFVTMALATILPSTSMAQTGVVDVFGKVKQQCDGKPAKHYKLDFLENDDNSIVYGSTRTDKHGIYHATLKVPENYKGHIAVRNILPMKDVRVDCDSRNSRCVYDNIVLTVPCG